MTNIIKLIEMTAALPGFSITYTISQSNIKERLLAELTAARYDVQTPDELSSLFSKNEKREFYQVLESLTTNGELIMLSPQIYWLKSVYDGAVEIIFAHFEKNEELTLALCRDMLGTSRKYALTFLEHLDGKQITKMHGNARQLIKNS